MKGANMRSGLAVQRRTAQTDRAAAQTAVNGWLKRLGF